MDSPTRLLRLLDSTLYTARFIRDHFLVIFGLGLVAAFGRAIQLQAFGPISPLGHILLEIIIETARILLFFYALGLTRIRAGLQTVIQLVTNKAERRKNGQAIRHNVGQNWRAILVNFGAFLVIAFLFNALTDHIAHETCLYITLKSRQLLSEQASVWVLILFVKNISVIPFTLVFEAVFFLWLIDRLPESWETV
ncbi:hypothetical protein [Spirosoma koreense]